MNPYDFVPIDLNNPPDKQRHAPLQHHKFEGICGSLTGKITAETPIFIKRGGSEEFMTNQQGTYIIPGTSLKGLFRSVVEMATNGCFGGKFDEKYKDRQRGTVNYSNKLSGGFKECVNPEQLCIACRVFGMLSPKKVFTGKVSFQDAECTHAVQHEAINTIDLMGPKPHHDAFYLDGKHIAGRKFYFHHPQGISTKKEHGRFNQRITPLNAGSEFTFSASFNNLEDMEWQALLYAIVLEPEMRHKVGYAKPSGFGSVKIEIDRIQLIDYEQRYTSPTRGITDYTGEKLQQYIDQQIKPYTSRQTETLQKFREIWRWNPDDTTQYHYPTAIDRNWFKNNPRTPISKTP